MRKSSVAATITEVSSLPAIAFATDAARVAIFVLLVEQPNEVQSS